MEKTRLEAFSDGVIAIAVSFYMPWASIGIYVSVALMWIVPDRRIEQMLID